LWEPASEPSRRCTSESCQPRLKCNPTNIFRLRQHGLNVKVFEKGASSGGIWYWNQYPGARVDSDTPIYQLFDKELWEDFTFRERYAGWQDLKRYFQHVEKKWDLLKDIEYNKNVEGATFDESRNQWLIECADGTEVYARWFIPAIGFAAKRYTPPIKGLSSFHGDVFHTAVWPQWGVNLKNKRIAVIGTGASGIQTIQELGPKAAHLTIYQRTPNYCLPMNQRLLDPKEEEEKKKRGEYEEAFKKLYTTFAGFTYDFQERNTFDDTPEQREEFFEELMIKQGGFRFWLNTYKDMLKDEKANNEAYNFWRKKVVARVPDPQKAALLAPENPPHPWGTKRPSLEQNFYEVVSLPHVDIVDLQTNPVEEVTEQGIRTKDGNLVEFDVIVLATGFDAVTGSLAQLNIRDTDGQSIKERWADGVRSSMGISISKFPNMFFIYGPQAPTAFSNGPSCVQLQANWIDKTIKGLEDKGIKRFVAKKEAEDEWIRRTREEWDATLFPRAKSWYQGSNIPGKKVEPLNW